MMKHMQKSFFAIAALVSAAQVMADCGTGSGSAMPYFSIRPQGVNVVRDILGWENLINRCDQDCFYGGFAITAEFDQSFRSNRLARCLFGDSVSSTSTNSCNTNCNTNCNDSCGSTLTISGSRAATRGANDWLADYFGLPGDFVSTISFCPRIRNFVADVQFYVGLDEWAQGLYFRLDLPIVWTRWNLCAKETVTTAGTLDAAAGYYAPSEVPVANLLSNALDFFTGAQSPTLPDGVTFQPLLYSKWCDTGCNTNCNTNCGTNNGNNCGNTRTRLADVAMTLGWNFVCCEDYHFGLNIRALAPTGNRPCGDCFFEPIVGNGGHWELGGGVSAHAVLWRCDESDNSFSVYLEGNVTHLFKACQTRVFDLCGLPNSRYMLAERLTSTVTNELSGSTTEGVGTLTASTAQFANEFAPVANLTRQQVDVTVAAQGDVAIKFEYATGCGFVWDIGYEFWGRSCEKFCRRTGCNLSTSTGTSLIDPTTWALKGDSQVYGFALDACGEDTPIALGATQGKTATILAGNNGFVPGNNAVAGNQTAMRNPGIDNAQFAVATVTGITQPVVSQPGGALQTRTSIQPVFITDALVDVAGTQGISNKIFTHFNYQWTDCEDWTPFLGVGAAVEFSSNNCNSNCNTSCNTSTSCSSSCDNGSTSCRRCALNQWGVWVKGGVTFN